MLLRYAHIEHDAEIPSVPGEKMPSSMPDFQQCCDMEAAPSSQVGLRVLKTIRLTGSLPSSILVVCRGWSSVSRLSRSHSAWLLGTPRSAPVGCQPLKRGWRAVLTDPNAQCTRPIREIGRASCRER